MSTKFKRQYLIEIEGDSTLPVGADKTLLEKSFLKILQDNVTFIQKILPFPSEKLKVKIKELQYLTDLDK